MQQYKLCVEYIVGKNNNDADFLSHHITVEGNTDALSSACALN